MTFDKAVKLMQKGKVVSRRSRAMFARNCGIGIVPREAGLDFACMSPGGSRMIDWAPDYNDVAAIDWEVVDCENPSADQVKGLFQ